MKGRSIVPNGIFISAAFLALSMSGCATSRARSERLVQGWTADGYEELRTEFEKNLRSRGELGGAFAAYVDGQKVVDLWGGWADPKRTRPWNEDTSVVVFSATKGVGALVLAHLHSRGLFDYDAKVSEYWPEFAVKGKSDVTVRQLLSHQAGIVLTAEPLNPKDLDGLARILADTEPMWTPGDYHGYHAGTIGFAMQVLVNRLDPKHRSINRYLQEEIAGPLGADFTIGLPEGYDVSRKATLKPFSPAEAMLHLGEMPAGLRKAILNSKSLFWKSLGDGKADINGPAFTDGENPSGNGVATARGLAALYGEIAAGGNTIGLTRQTVDIIFGPPESPRLGRLDKVMNMEAYFGLGFQKPNPGNLWFCDDPNAIGFLGASGAIGVGDRRYALGFAYVTDRMSPGNQINDPRERALRDALYRAVRAQKGGNR